MVFGISMNPLDWVITVTGVVFALIVPFAIAGQLATMVPELLSGPTRMAIGYISMPFLLCYLNDRGALNGDLTSVFFYLYKWAYLIVGLAAVALAIFAGGGFEGGLLLFGLVTTVIGLVIFWQSWKVDRRNQQIADRLMYGPEEPLDRKTLAILDAAQSRTTKSSQPVILNDPVQP